MMTNTSTQRISMKTSTNPVQRPFRRDLQRRDRAQGGCSRNCSTEEEMNEGQRNKKGVDDRS
jgi:hypothetical protein